MGHRHGAGVGAGTAGCELAGNGFGGCVSSQPLSLPVEGAATLACSLTG